MESPTTTKDAWLVQLAGMQLGPMPWDELVGMAQRGELTSDDLVRAVSQSDWQPAGSLKRLHQEQEPETDASDGAELHGSRTDAAEPEQSFRSSNRNSASDSGTKSFKNSAVPSDTTDDYVQKRVDIDSKVSSPPMSATAVMSETVVDSKAETLPDLPKVSEKKRAVPRESSGDSLPKSGWRYRHGNSQFGPIDLQELQDLIEVGLLLPEDEVKIPGARRWSSIQDISEFGPGSSKSTAAAVSHSTAAATVPDQEPKRASELNSSAAESMPVAKSSGGFLDKLMSPVAFVIGFVTTARKATAAIVSLVVVVAWMLSGGGSGHDAYVRGRIQLDGEPLRNATITFSQLENGWGASARLDEDGCYEISTLRGGLLPGDYRISLMPSEPEPDHVLEALQKQFLRDTGRSVDEQLELELEEQFYTSQNPQREEEETINLPAGTIPIRYRSLETSDLKTTLVSGKNNDVSFKLASKK